MQDSKDYDMYNRFICDLKHVIFYIPNLGVLRLGKLARNVIPATYVIGDESNEDIKEQFLSRVFVHHAHNKDDIKEVVDFLSSLGFVPVICADYELPNHHDIHIYNDSKIYGNNHVFVISSNNICNPSAIRNTILESKKNFRSSFSDEAVDSIKTVVYDTDSKPLKQKIYDAILYSECWSLLTTQEKVIRCIFSVLSLSIPLIPPIILLSYLGNLELREQAYSMNLLPWQYRVYSSTSQNIYDVMINGTDEKRQRIMRSNIMKEAKKRKFIVECEGEEGEQPTDLGKKVSEMHNLLLIAHNKELSKKQLLLRVVTFSVLAFVCFSNIVALACYFTKADTVALYCSMLSYFVIFVQGIYLISLKSTISKICAAICMVFAGFMLMVTGFLLYRGSIEFGSGPIISGVIVVITGIMLGIALICNRYYKQDRDLVSKLGGISTTAYLSMKKQICEIDKVKSVELEGGCDYQIIDSLKLALFNAYKAGLFGCGQQSGSQGNVQGEGKGLSSDDVEEEIFDRPCTSISKSQISSSDSQSLNP